MTKQGGLASVNAEPKKQKKAAQSRRTLGNRLNIIPEKEQDAALSGKLSEAFRLQAALLELAKLNFSSLDRAFKLITEIDARTLDIDRVSIWLFDEERKSIICEDLFLKKEARHEKGLILYAKDYPRYFQALEESRVVAADDVFADPRTNEFSSTYLNPLGISSMMDVPIRRRGRVIGVVCHEHIGRPRQWTTEEQNFGISISDIVTITLEAWERRRTEKVNQSILKISEAAISARNLEALYRSIHQIVAELMPAQNFYIALYDAGNNVLSFPYFVDEYDTPPGAKRPGKGLTEYVLRTGEPLLASPEVFARLEKQGEVESLGAPSIDWLGVPLKIDGQTIGVLVVQSYTEGIRYGEEEKSLLKFVSDQVAMAIHRQKSTEEVEERERFLASIFESIQDGISILDEAYRIIRVNRTMEKWYAHAMPLVGKKCFEAYHLRKENCLVCPTRKTIETHQSAHEVVPRIGEGGEITGWLDLFSFPLVDKTTGQMKGIIEYVRDITEHKKAEDRLQASLQEKEVLLREVHHRVKNNMQVISSLLNLQARRISDPTVLEMFKDSQRRIRSMALVHERLYQSSDLSRIEFSTYLRDLATHLFHSCQTDSSRIRLLLDTEQLYLNINTAIPCGLIVNELVSNAFKHAFPGGRSGEVEVSFRRLEGDGYQLRVRDDGIGFPENLDPRQTESLGLQIVSTLVSQLDGELKLDRRNGTAFTLIFNEVAGKKRG